MSLAAVGHDDVFRDRRAIAVTNLTSDWLVRWSDGDGAWYQCLPSRLAENKEQQAKVMVTFARAYMVALESAQHDPTFDLRNLPDEDERKDTCKSIPQILAGIQKTANAKGEVTMGGVVRSFQWCPGLVFCQTLTLLTWAGHIGSFSTLGMYKHTFQVVVEAYWSNDQMLFRDRTAQVRSIHDRHILFIMLEGYCPWATFWATC